MQLSATRGSAINVLQVVFSFAWDVLLLRNEANNLGLIGAMMVIVGVISVTMLGEAVETENNEGVEETTDIKQTELTMSCREPE